jgi:flagellar biosynthesis protein FlhB
MKSEKGKIVLALVVFLVTFVVFKYIFSNWDYIKSLLFEG